MAKDSKGDKTKELERQNGLGDAKVDPTPMEATHGK